MLEKMKKFLIDNRVIIISTYIVGLITHFYLYSNNLICSDALEKGQYCIAGKWEQTLGRWAIQFFDMLRGGIVSSIIIVIVSLGFLALASIYISKMFNIKNNYLKVLIALLIVVSPQIANTFLYTYCADAYCAAMFTSVLTVYFMEKKEKKYYLLSGIFLIFTLAIYQAFLAVIMTLIVFKVIFDILENTKSTKEILLSVLKYAIIGVVGSIVYYVITLIVLKLQGWSLASYGGANSFGINNLLGIKDYIVNTYKNFYKYFFKENIILNQYWKRNVMNLLLFIFSAISGIVIIVKNKLYKEKLKMLILVVCVIILPVTINIINIISPTYSICLIMLESALLVYIAALRLSEFLENGKFEKILRIGIIGVIVALIWTFIMSDSALYMVRKEVENNYYTVSMGILNRVENLDGYNSNLKWMFNDSIHYKSKLAKYATGLQSNGDETWNNFLGTTTNEQFYQRYLGKKIKVCSEEEYKEIIRTKEYKDMGIYPNKSSIKIINNIVVIKLSNNTF